MKVATAGTAPFNGTRCILIALLLPAATMLRAGEIDQVSATPRQILLRGRADSPQARIVELELGQTAVLSHPTPGFAAEIPAPGEFRTAISRFDGSRDRIYSGFMLRTTPGPTNQPSVRYVSEFLNIARSGEPFPEAASKKGLQVQMVDDALALGIKHAALNVDLVQLVDLARDTNSHSLVLDGECYRFRRDPVDRLDRQVKPLSDAGVLVSLILLCYRSGQEARDRIMLHPQFDEASPNGLSAFNTATSDGLRHLKACVEFLAERYSGRDRAHGRVVNFIVGNEVNSHWFWCNRGRVPMETFADDYLKAVRLVHTAIRKYSSSARVYVSLEHHWNIRYAGGDALQTFPGRAFLDEFNRRSKAGGDFDWHLAFHPYPEDLFEPRTWNDRSATPGEDAPRITFKNLELLPRYLRKNELCYRGRPRRIILSEQGFHTPDTPDGERLQAAAYCYAYAKARRLEGIDAFIYHRHVDHAFEGGLKLGLWRRDEASSSPSQPAARKRIHEVFRLADGPDWKRAFEFALPVIGITQWE